ncbi:unnamed protein product [Penicillium camemberti]|uniref:Str. FM013 n=1 Tax=Penicillium camemberti (strain FM 013) TaxID=1429867 RepID=A0A0G4PFU8_PENC3|nr:unnamed protein product [Penicillium camemberti]
MNHCVLIPIGFPAEALTHHPTKVTKVKIPTKNPLGPVSCYQFPFGRRELESPVWF